MIILFCKQSKSRRFTIKIPAKRVGNNCNIETGPLQDNFVLMLGKPGGLTTSEALAKGLPFVIINPIRGQEERNADHLLEEGAAIRCNNLPVLAYKIDELLSDHVRLDNMRANAKRLGRPRSACEIVGKLLSLRSTWAPK